MKAALVLGCKGRTRQGIIMCPGTQSIIFDLKDLPDTDQAAYNYLDSHCRLFDGPSTDHNKIGNVLSHLSKSGYIDSNTMDIVYEFFAMHKKCGMFLYILPD